LVTLATVIALALLATPAHAIEYRYRGTITAVYPDPGLTPPVEPGDPFSIAMELDTPSRGSAGIPFTLEVSSFAWSGSGSAFMHEFLPEGTDELLFYSNETGPCGRTASIPSSSV
jgi:hypothetical protein